MNTLSKKLNTMTAVAAVALLLPICGSSQTTIGSWQASSDDGWIDWANQSVGLFDASNAGKYSLASGAVPGYGQSLQITRAGYQQNLAIKLQNNGYADDFMNNHLLSFTFSVPGFATSGATAGYSQLYELAINAQTYGFHSQPFNSNWSSTGDNGNNGSGGAQPNFYFWNGSPVQSQRVTLDYSSILSSFPANPGWVELIYSFNNGDGAPANYYINDVVLSGGVVPEPSSMALFGLGAAGLLAIRRRNQS